WPSSNTSMASIIRVAATQHRVGKAPSLSKGKWLKRALGAARKRDRSNTGEDDKILEHWDVIAAYEGTTSSGEDMVGGPSEPSDLDKGEANKALVLEYVKQVLTEGEIGRVADFVSPSLIQREPALGSGLHGLTDALSFGAVGSYDMVFKLVGEGDLVVTYSRVHRGGADHAVFDIYRVEDNLIAEHWGIAEALQPRERWGNSGKF
ncbi:MAG: hypothetical protein AAF216_13100, partial [Pseudomonadota bacterium]